LTISR